MTMQAINMSIIRFMKTRIVGAIVKSNTRMNKTVAVRVQRYMYVLLVLFVRVLQLLKHFFPHSPLPLFTFRLLCVPSYRT